MNTGYKLTLSHTKELIVVDLKDSSLLYVEDLLLYMERKKSKKRWANSEIFDEMLNWLLENHPELFL